MGLQITLLQQDSKIFHEQVNAYWHVSEVNIDVTSDSVQYRLSAYASRDAALADEEVYHASFDDLSLPDIARSTWLYTAIQSAVLSDLEIDGGISRDNVITALYQYIKASIPFFMDAIDIFEEE